jgi:Mn-dependent DtxR family transcriptional regulator
LIFCSLSAYQERLAEADAEGIEHYVSETTLQAFARFLRSRT